MRVAATNMNTKTLSILLLGLFLGTGLCLAASNDAENPMVSLKGIVDLGGTKIAYIEAAAPVFGSPSVILSEGERTGDIEVVQINLPQRKVSIRVRDEARNLTFDSGAQTGTLVEPSSSNPPSGNTVGLCLEKMGLNQILNLYVRLANRTVLRPARLPTFELSLYTKGSVSSADLMSAIANALKQNDVFIQPHGDKFLIVAREGEVSLVAPDVKAASDALASSLAQTSGSNADELLPAGLISLQNTDLSQVVQIYSDLVGRTIIRPTALPAMTIKLFTATPLTRSEAIYSLSATLALNGVSLMPAGEKFVFVYPTAQKGMAAGILARKPAAAAAGTNSIPAGSINLMAAALPVVAGLYREISGQSLELNADLPNVRILFRSQTALTPDEALLGFEYVLAWNRLVIEKAENKLILKRAGGDR